MIDLSVYILLKKIESQFPGRFPGKEELIRRRGAVCAELPLKLLDRKCAYLLFKQGEKLELMQ